MKIKTISGSVLFESDAQSIKELLVEAVKLGTDLSESDLVKADLFRAYLFRADLSRANLSKAVLANANLSDADLSGADLSGANLFRTDLSGADLSGADLSGADLSGSFMQGAFLWGADLSRTNLSRTYLTGVNGLLPRGICPLQILGTRQPLIVREPGFITIGCEHQPVAWWEEHYKALGRTEGYSKKEVNEYRNYIAMAKYWMKLYECEAQ